MDRPNETFYPISASLYDAITKDPSWKITGMTRKSIIESMLDTVAEYEHGTADVEDVIEQEQINLRQYAAVTLDLMLVVVNS